MKVEFIKNFIKLIARQPSLVEVSFEEGEPSTINVKVAASDLGRVLGYKGRNIKALKSVLIANKYNASLVIKPHE